MPNVDKAKRREQKQHKDRYGMRMSGRSTKTLLLHLLGRKPKRKK